MGTHFGVGFSNTRDPVVAGQEAVRQALQHAGIEKPDFVFLFATAGHPQEAVLSAVREATGRAPLAGCSMEGVITNGLTDESNYAVGVTVIKSDEMRFRNALVTGLKQDSESVGRRMAEALQPQVGQDAVGVFVMADGMTVNWDLLLEGFQKTIKHDKFLPMLGGLAGDAFEFRATFQYSDDQVVQDGVACVLLSGDVRLATAINSGNRPFGTARTITRAQGNTILEIDGKPALDVFKEYLTGSEMENWTKEAVLNLCLAFEAPSGFRETHDDYVIRFVPSKDDASKSISLPTNVVAGQKFWLSRRDKQHIMEGVDQVVQQIKAQLGDAKPKMVFQFDCAGRGKALFRDQEKLAMLTRLQAGIGSSTPWMGAHTFGEIGPVGQTNAFHNYTLVLSVLY